MHVVDGTIGFWMCVCVKYDEVDVSMQLYMRLCNWEAYVWTKNIKSCSEKHHCAQVV